LQITEFGQGKEIDQLISKMVLYRSGGGNDHESYELAAYFYLNHCEIANSEYPFFFITGDEGYWDSFSHLVVKEFLGKDINSGSIDAFQVWQLLKEKFNVFLVKKKYRQKEIIQWNKALGEERVLDIEHPKAVMDIILGAIALTTGSRTMDTYIKDMKEREQTKERIDEVCKALKKYNDLLVKGQVNVVKVGGENLSKQIKANKADLSSLKEILPKVVGMNVTNDKVEFFNGLRKLKKELVDKVPENIICPITGEIFFEPVSTVDGLTYEKAAIEYWFQKNDTSPETGLKLNSKNLLPNFVIKKFVLDYYELNKKNLK